MAQEMDDLEFLLPSELLTDDDLLTDIGGGFGKSGGISSDLSSPVESVPGAWEAGSDEDDAIAELTRKLTRSGLGDSSLSCDYTAKGFKLSGSPQSTLYGFKAGSKGSSNSDSRACSPPEAKNALSWDLLYAAAEEVARLRMVEDTPAFYSHELFPPVRKHSRVAVPKPKSEPGTGFYHVRPQMQIQLSYQQLQAAKLKQMKQNQLMLMKKIGVMEQGNVEYQLRYPRIDGGGDLPNALSMAPRPTLHMSQQQTRSGMKSVFVGETGPKKQRVGTGVFMPRRFGSNPAEIRKQPEFCLNPNMDSLDAAHVPPGGAENFSPDYDYVLNHGNNLMAAAYQGRNMRRRPFGNQELRLPQEWSY